MNVCVGVWVCGCVEVWVCGLVDVLSCGYMVVWVCRSVEDKQREEKESDPQEWGTGDAISVALPLDRGDKGKVGA